MCSETTFQGGNCVRHVHTDGCRFKHVAGVDDVVIMISISHKSSTSPVILFLPRNWTENQCCLGDGGGVWRRTNHCHGQCWGQRNARVPERGGKLSGRNSQLYSMLLNMLSLRRRSRFMKYTFKIIALWWLNDSDCGRSISNTTHPMQHYSSILDLAYFLANYLNPVVLLWVFFWIDLRSKPQIHKWFDM